MREQIPKILKADERMAEADNIEFRAKKKVVHYNTKTVNYYDELKKIRKYARLARYKMGK